MNHLIQRLFGMLVRKPLLIAGLFIIGLAACKSDKKEQESVEHQTDNVTASIPNPFIEGDSQ